MKQPRGYVYFRYVLTYIAWNLEKCAGVRTPDHLLTSPDMGSISLSRTSERQ